ncbi:class I SAM-dependent methyltransferase [Thiomicrorhabdus heinhorstiae]|uniref:Class I SAM-dependent methyltransferase n=1 Tax=Thiomicrorhabdus heinhorstiae TaxID=2748010 RepID=A0ABS0BVH7_9GAMM|nr:class I SAM-dependent methyltransferase [Thiomicrorhabdus heinhorstiae]MBF6057354.1 class I SAM-dependent methyltransferase [Thiomicrorhabdus heinhorstiae]
MPKTQGYESHADAYDQWFDDNHATYQAEIDAVKRLLPSGRGIEVGAGSGRFTQPLNIDTGIEPAKAMRDRAKQERNLDLIEGVAESLPIEDRQYDFAAFITSTCFLDDPEQAYLEAARVTKAAGSIIVAFLERNSELGQAYEKHKHESPFYCDATFYSYPEIESMLQQAGFSIVGSVQTVLPESSGNEATAILDGHDEGTFVVVRAEKTQ